MPMVKYSRFCPTGQNNNFEVKYMKNIIKHICAVLAALTIIVSLLGTTSNVAFACNDDYSEAVTPLWEEEENTENDDRS